MFENTKGITSSSYNRIGIKVSIVVNLILFVVMAIGTLYIIYQQTKSLETQLFKRGKILSIAGAACVGKIFDKAIDNNVFSIEDVFDTDYVAIPGFDPPKYHTKYDSYLDNAILEFEDKFLKDENVLYAVAFDINCYIPTHNTRYQKGLTGNKIKDLLGNRTKRIFNDTIGLQAVENKKDGFLQIYHRDTGERIWDISTPVYVKNRRWGGFRLGLSLEAIDKSKKEMQYSLIFIMGFILIISMISIMIVVNKILFPLHKFSIIASQLANGQVDEKIESSSNDEIGHLAKALENLRVSLKSSQNNLTPKK